MITCYYIFITSDICIICIAGNGIWTLTHLINKIWSMLLAYLLWTIEVNDLKIGSILVLVVVNDVTSLALNLPARIWLTPRFKAYRPISVFLISSYLLISSLLSRFLMHMIFLVELVYILHVKRVLGTRVRG